MVEPVEVIEGEESEEDEDNGPDVDVVDGIQGDDPSHLSHQFAQVDGMVDEVSENLHITKTIGEDRKVEQEKESENEQMVEEIVND